MSDVTMDISQLSSGTIAVLLREGGFPNADWETCDYMQRSFLSWVQNNNPYDYVNWTQAWNEFVVAGGLVDMHDYSYGDM